MFSVQKHGYGNLTMAHLYTHHLLLQALPFPPCDRTGQSPPPRRGIIFKTSGVRERHLQRWICEEGFQMSVSITDDVNPTLDEITQFTRRQDGGDDHVVNLSIIAEVSRKAAIAVLQPGDQIEVFEGEHAGLHGVVEEVAQEVVTITAHGLEID